MLAGATSPTGAGPRISEETVGGWVFRSVSSRISSGPELSALEHDLGLPSVPLPEALFGSNEVEIRHARSGFAVRFSARGAIASWHCRQSRVSAEAGGPEISATNFDWTYQNEYDGDVSGTEGATSFAPSSDSLPLALLRRHDDILWSCDLPLYEDDLHDRGVRQMVAR